MQPIIDALKIRPFITNLNCQHVCIVKGIYDHYVLEMFLSESDTNRFLPAVNADSIRFFISLAIAWRLSYVALWDDDTDGRIERERAVKFFGPVEDGRLLLLPGRGRRKKFVLQNLIAGDDMRLIRDALQVGRNTSFERTILLLYHSPKRKDILTGISHETTAAVEKVLEEILAKQAVSTMNVG